MDELSKYSKTKFACLAAAAAAASVAACTDLAARRRDYLVNQSKWYTEKSQACEAFEKALTAWAEKRQQTPDSEDQEPDSEDQKPELSDFYIGGHISSDNPRRILRPVTAGFGVAAVALLVAACVVIVGISQS